MKGNNNYTIYDNFEKALATLKRFLSYDLIHKFLILPFL